MTRATEDAEHLADIIDRASRTEARLNACSVAHVRGKAAPEQVPDADGCYAITECKSCGESLSLARLKTGRVRCVPCVEAEEEAHRRAGKR